MLFKKKSPEQKEREEQFPSLRESDYQLVQMILEREKCSIAADEFLQDHLSLIDKINMINKMSAKFDRLRKNLAEIEKRTLITAVISRDKAKEILKAG